MEDFLVNYWWVLVLASLYVIGAINYLITAYSEYKATNDTVNYRELQSQHEELLENKALILEAKNSIKETGSQFMDPAGYKAYEGGVCPVCNKGRMTYKEGDSGPSIRCGNSTNCDFSLIIKKRHRFRNEYYLTDEVVRELRGYLEEQHGSIQ